MYHTNMQHMILCH